MKIFQLAELSNKHEASFKKLVLKKSLNNKLFQSIKKPVDIETFKKLNEKRNVTNKDKTIRRYNNFDTKVGKLEHILLFLKQVDFQLSTDEIPFIRQHEDNDAMSKMVVSMNVTLIWVILKTPMIILKTMKTQNQINRKMILPFHKRVKQANFK